MKEKQWIVIRCLACKNCHGSNGHYRKCPHCGNKISDNSEIVSTVNSDAELRLEVAIANTPDHLKEALRGKLKSSDSLAQKSPETAFTMAKWVEQAADENGEVSFDSLSQTLASKNTSINADDLISMAETQGMLLRIGQNRWTLLG